MKRVSHPGPPAPERLQIAASSGRIFNATLEAGVPLSHAVAEMVRREGLQGGYLDLTGAAAAALAYVAPAGPRDARTVAWYSETRRFTAGGRIDRLGMVVGADEAGAPFVHGHGLWTPEGGPTAMGHILADQTALAAPATALCVGLQDARFARRFDPESNFTLFQPEARAAAADADFALLRIAPNEEFGAALRQACARLGWDSARAYGLGSLTDAVFADGAALGSEASEFLVLDAVARADAAAAPPIEIAIVGVEDGRILRGPLAPGRNGVFVTAEIVLARRPARVGAPR